MFRFSACLIPCLLLAFANVPACFAGGAGVKPQTQIKTSRQSASVWFELLPSTPREGTTIKDPKAFSEWLEAVAEPQVMTALGAVMLDSGMSGQALAEDIDPSAIRNSAEFTDPYLYMRWVLASGNPSLQRAIVSGRTEMSVNKRAAGASRTNMPSAIIEGMGQLSSLWIKAARPSNCLPLARALSPIQPGSGGIGRAQTSSAKVGGFDPDGWFRLPPDVQAVSTLPRYRY